MLSTVLYKMGGKLNRKIPQTFHFIENALYVQFREFACNLVDFRLDIRKDLGSTHTIDWHICSPKKLMLSFFELIVGRVTWANDLSSWCRCKNKRIYHYVSTPYIQNRAAAAALFFTMPEGIY